MRNGRPGGLNVERIEQSISAASAKSAAGGPPSLPPDARQHFLQIALALADQ
jgi:hypothetical protein